ncbi:D-xylose transporter XylE [Asticcacaulis endophyticus]|uniref:D-xylose transporter XylE n=1 Tax=Asticcacaulis endophyticus TaxID=1395890 RepID=A0A918UQW4_9CAUL|nr:D-xylose transporter XylE [Asticcacaulis endophyticus]GGZ28118.1 D-xylose transporter XylE [Asticcacaulis endophyticus]
MTSSQVKVNMGLVMGLAIGAALGGLLFGYDTAVISGAEASIKHNYILPNMAWDETQKNFFHGLAVGIALLGCVIGSAIAGPLATKFGRRAGMMIAAALFFVSSILSGFPETFIAPIGTLGVDTLWPYMIYRVFGGIAIGMASLISPMYIAEIAPAKHRGLLVSLQQIAIVVGITLVYFVNMKIAEAGHGDDTWINALGWRYMLASCAIPAALFLTAAFLMPDTPRWYMMKGHEAKAEKLLHELNDPDTAKATMAEIRGSLVNHSGKLLSFGSGVLLVGILLSVFQQVVGINAVLYYAPSMFKNVGMETNAAMLQTVIMGVAMVVFTIIALFTVDNWGRKPLLILGAVVMAVSLFFLGYLYQTHQQGMIFLVTAIVYIAGFSLSWGPIVWVLLAEMFPNSIKGTAMSIAVAAQWIANYIVSQTFPMMDGNSTLIALFNHGFSFYVYGAFSVLAAIFVWKFVPETKGKTLEAIEGLWKKS